jgi:hypothetical protein
MAAKAMKVNLMREWREVGRILLEQTSAVPLNPEDPKYGEYRAAIVWRATRAYRRAYRDFVKDVKSKRADAPENDPEPQSGR